MKEFKIWGHEKGSKNWFTYMVTAKDEKEAWKKLREYENGGHEFNSKFSSIKDL